MKLNIRHFLVLLTIVSISSCDFNFTYDNGLPEKQYSDGTLKSDYEVKNGKIHGEYIEYHENGNVLIKGLYNNGSAEGEWIEYYQNGVTLQVNHYNKDMLHGDQQGWHENGQLALVGDYVNNKEEGKHFYFGLNGDTLKIETYENGIMVDLDTRKESKSKYEN